MTYDRTVYTVHHSDKDAMASPHELPDAASALNKSGRTRNKRVVSKVTVERIDGDYKETGRTASREEPDRVAADPPVQQSGRCVLQEEQPERRQSRFQSDGRTSGRRSTLRLFAPVGEDSGRR